MKQKLFVTFALLSIGATSWARSFTKTAWSVSYQYSNAYQSEEVKPALVISGQALYSSDGALCELTVSNKRYKCKVDLRYDTLSVTVEDWKKLLFEGSQLFGSNGPRTREIVLAKLNQMQITDALFMGGMSRNYSTVQLHDPNSNFESVHMTLNADEIAR